RTIQALQQQQQQNQQLEQQRWLNERFVEAEKILREQVGPTYDSEVAPTMWETLAEHPSMLNQNHFADPEELAADFVYAYEYGKQRRADEAADAKWADDDRAFKRIEAAQRRSWSGFRDFAETGAH